MQKRQSKYGPERMFKDARTRETWGVLNKEFIQSLMVNSGDYVFENGSARLKVPPAQERKLICSFCKEEFKTAESFLNHLKTFESFSGLLTQSNLPIEGMDAIRNQENERLN